MVVMLDFHFNIETHEFSQVTMGVWVFSTENWSNFEYSHQVTFYSHLLVQLWWLSQECCTVKVVNLENTCTTFTSSCNQLWCVDFREALGVKVLAEEHLNSGLNAPDCKVSWCSHINDTIVQSNFLADFVFFGLECVFNGKWKCFSFSDNVALGQVKFNFLLSAWLDVSCDNLTDNFYNGFTWNPFKKILQNTKLQNC